MVTVAIEGNTTELGDFEEADRIEGFPFIYDGDYMYYHYRQERVG